jgi:hypothetical protein
MVGCHSAGTSGAYCVSGGSRVRMTAITSLLVSPSNGTRPPMSSLPKRVYIGIKNSNLTE